MVGMNYKSLFQIFFVLAGVCLHQSDALACGGCFVPPEESTQVTGHRMIMSIGQDQSTLYDQIEYVGSPESFAWVLPIKGQVDIGVSSDLVFNQLGFDTAVSIAPPPLDCPAYYNCGPTDNFGTAGSATSASGGAGEVEVIAQEVVGPYETVQLSANDPIALQKWLADHGYNLPQDIEPLIASYVNEKFNFLAVKLVPGEDVQAMQPIRITTQGSNVVLPLRMVAAGTGALTTITLFVLSEFRVEPANFPTFEINTEDIFWDYTKDRSNYTELRSFAYDITDNFGWLTEASRQYSPTSFKNQIFQVLEMRGPEQSGYGTEYESASQAAIEDMNALFSGMNENSVWVTRLRAELSRKALNADLVLQATINQEDVSNYIQTKKFIGEQPKCPPPPPGCEEENENETVITGGRGCAVGNSNFSMTAFGVFILFSFLVFYRRRN